MFNQLEQLYLEMNKNIDIEELYLRLGRENIHEENIVPTYVFGNVCVPTCGNVHSFFIFRQAAIELRFMTF